MEFETSDRSKQPQEKLLRLMDERIPFPSKRLNLPVALLSMDFQTAA